MNCDELQHLAALAAIGALDGPALARLEEAAAANPELQADRARLLDAAAALAQSVPQRAPPARLRGEILRRIAATPQATPLSPAAAAKSAGPVNPGIRFARVGEGAWFNAPIPGGRFRPLSIDTAQGIALLLIELAAGAVYPEHDHVGSEHMYILTGDLTSEGNRLGPGDYLHGEPGTHHGALTTEQGCTAIMVVPLATVAEFLPA